MAVDMFMKIDTVDGEAQDSKHKKEIDVLTWSWGISNAGSAHNGSGAGAGKANVQDLTFTKWVDTATPKLALACCSGKHFKDATLVIRKAGDKPVEYVKIKMDTVIITSVSTGGSGGEDRLQKCDAELCKGKSGLCSPRRQRSGGHSDTNELGYC